VGTIDLSMTQTQRRDKVPLLAVVALDGALRPAFPWGRMASAKAPLELGDRSRAVRK